MSKSKILYEGTPGVRVTLSTGQIIDLGHRDLFVSAVEQPQGNLMREGHTGVSTPLPLDAQRALRDALTRAIIARDPRSERDLSILAIQEALPRR
jgi:hypothetical protein